MKNTLASRLVLPLLSIGVAWHAAPVAAQQPQWTPPPPTYREGLNEYPTGDSLAWLDEKLDGNDKPFMFAQQQITALRQKKRLNKAVVARYEQIYAANPQSALALCRWVYAVNAWHGPELEWRNAMIRFTSEHFWRVQSPRAYHYARVRWVAQVVGGTQYHRSDRQKLRNYGKRLLLRNPNDRTILFQMVNLSDTKESLVYANRLVKLAPKDPSSVSSLAFVRFLKFLGSHSQADADAAIAAHQKVLPLLSPNDQAGRKNIQRTIAHIRKVRQRWAKKVS